MINLRYHIVSITAVFLALAIGITLGSSLIQRYTIDTLEGRLDELGERLDRTDGENRVLRDTLRDRDALAEQLRIEGRGIYAGHLDEVGVLVVSVQGSDDDLVAEVRASLRAAGASLSGTLVFTSRWDELSADEVTELSELLNRRLGSEQAARTMVLRQLGDELLAATDQPPEPEPEPEPEPTLEPDGEGEPGAQPGADAGAAPALDDDGAPGPDGVDGTDGGDEQPIEPTPGPDPVPDGDLVAALTDLGYLEFLPESAAAPLASFGLRIAVVADDDAALEPDRALAPLLEAMAMRRNGPLPVVVAGPLVEVENGESSDGRPEFAPSQLVSRIRSTPLRQVVSTIDDARSFVGQASIVLALAALGDGSVGHYGVGEGVESLVPAGAL